MSLGRFSLLDVKVAVTVGSDDCKTKYITARVLHDHGVRVSCFVFYVIL